MTKMLVIIPTYNERENLAAISARVLAQTDVDLLVVDDNSPDGTGLIADELCAHNLRMHVLHRAGKGGLGAAYRAGFAWGIENDFDILVELDGDGSHQPEELDRIREALLVSDMVIGSRWVSGGAVKNWPWHRLVLSRAGSWYARVALGLPFRDVTGGYRAFSAKALNLVKFDEVSSQGYCFQVEMLLRAWRENLTIAEVPITFIEREFGSSKMSGRIVIEAMARVTWWGITGLRQRLSRSTKSTKLTKLTTGSTSFNPAEKAVTRVS